MPLASARIKRIQTKRRALGKKMLCWRLPARANKIDEVFCMIVLESLGKAALWFSAEQHDFSVGSYLEVGDCTNIKI